MFQERRMLTTRPSFVNGDWLNQLWDLCFNRRYLLGVHHNIARICKASGVLMLEIYVSYSQWIGTLEILEGYLGDINYPYQLHTKENKYSYANELHILKRDLCPGCKGNNFRCNQWYQVRQGDYTSYSVGKLTDKHHTITTINQYYVNSLQTECKPFSMVSLCIYKSRWRMTVVQK